LKNSILYVCEVASHTGGLGYGSSKTTNKDKIIDKFRRARKYVKEQYTGYKPKNVRYMFWAPVVGGPKRWEEVQGAVAELKREKERIDLELFTEDDYSKELQKLRVEARPPLERNATDPILRFLQLEERAKRRVKKASDSS